MLPDRVSNPGTLTDESGALPIALRGPAGFLKAQCLRNILQHVSPLAVGALRCNSLF